MRNLERDTDRLLMVLGTVAIVFVVGIRIALLDRGMIFSDDAWYYALIKFNPVEGPASRYYKLFQFGWQDSIYALHVMSVAMQLAALVFLGYALWRYLKNFGSQCHYALCLGVIALGAISIPDLITPNYISLNLVYGLTATSFLLLWLSNRRWWNLLLCGFAASCLFTSQITCLVLLPVILGIVVCLSDNKWRDAGVIVAGAVCFALAYCTLIESPKEILGSVTALSKRTISRGSNAYGYLFLLQWCFESAVYILKYTLMAWGLNVIYNRFGKVLWAGAFCVVVAFCICLVGIHYKTYNAWGIPWLLISLFLIRRYKSLTRERMMVIALFVLMPIILCLGTNVIFRSCQTRYVVFLLPVIFLLVRPTWKMRLLATMCYALLLLRVVAVELPRGNWFGDKIAEQTIPVSTIGIDQNLKLSSQNIDKLRYCQEHIPAGSACFFSFDMWGIGALLCYDPQSYSYRLPEKDDLAERISQSLEQCDTVYVVMSQKEPVEIEINEKNCSMQEGNGARIYKYSK